MSTASINRENITTAYQLIRPHVRRTPVVEASGADFGLDSASLTFKLELLQHSGSFKARGAFTNLLTRKIPPAGVVAASGGNHGAAIAFAASKIGKAARIFVPTVCSPEKVERIRSYGAHLVVDGERYADALAASEAWAAQSGALRIHAYDQIETLRGQGTVGLEWEEQSPDMDTLLVSVGELMFPIAQAHVQSVLLVSDLAIQQAQAALWNVLRVVTEPGGAAAFAALLSRQYVPKPEERVGVLLCGGNTIAVDFNRSVAGAQTGLSVPDSIQAAKSI